MAYAKGSHLGRAATAAEDQNLPGDWPPGVAPCSSVPSPPSSVAEHCPDKTEVRCSIHLAGTWRSNLRNVSCCTAGSSAWCRGTAGPAAARPGSGLVNVTPASRGVNILKPNIPSWLERMRHPPSKRRFMQVRILPAGRGNNGRNEVVGARGLAQRRLGVFLVLQRMWPPRAC